MLRRNLLSRAVSLWQQLLESVSNGTDVYNDEWRAYARAMDLPALWRPRQQQTTAAPPRDVSLPPPPSASSNTSSVCFF